MVRGLLGYIFHGHNPSSIKLIICNKNQPFSKKIDFHVYMLKLLGMVDAAKRNKE